MMNGLIAFLPAAAVAYGLSSAFYTQQTLAVQADVGIIYTPAQIVQTAVANFLGLAPSFGVVIAIALAIGFLVAWGVKRVLTPLAPIAYPAAGAAAIMTLIFIIDNLIFGGGAGLVGGAGTIFGLMLQGFAGLVGGLVFAALLTRN